jgi:hypothetical protein
VLGPVGSVVVVGEVVLGGVVVVVDVVGGEVDVDVDGGAVVGVACVVGGSVVVDVESGALEVDELSAVVEVVARNVVVVVGGSVVVGSPMIVIVDPDTVGTVDSATSEVDPPQLARKTITIRSTPALGFKEGRPSGLEIHP